MVRLCVFTTYERLSSLQTSILPTLSHQTWNDMISNVDDISDLIFHEKQKAKSAIWLLRSLFIQNLGNLIDDEHPETLRSRNFVRGIIVRKCNLIEGMNTVSLQM